MLYIVFFTVFFLFTKGYSSEKWRNTGSQVELESEPGPLSTTGMHSPPCTLGLCLGSCQKVTLILTYQWEEGLRSKCPGGPQSNWQLFRAMEKAEQVEHHTSLHLSRAAQFDLLYMLRFHIKRKKIFQSLYIYIFLKKAQKTSWFKNQSNDQTFGGLILKILPKKRGSKRVSCLSPGSFFEALIQET